jgi:hypothetical protein
VPVLERFVGNVKTQAIANVSAEAQPTKTHVHRPN